VTKLWWTRRKGREERMGEDSNEYMSLVGKPEEKKALGRPMHK
jgi:hypothetical protein